MNLGKYKPIRKPLINFAVLTIIFGICYIGSAVYNRYFGYKDIAGEFSPDERYCVLFKAVNEPNYSVSDLRNMTFYSLKGKIFVQNTDKYRNIAVIDTYLWMDVSSSEQSETVTCHPNLEVFWEENLVKIILKGNDEHKDRTYVVSLD